jgi:hypothetical protein
MNKVPPKSGPRPSEEGYVLVAVIFMMAILILSLSVAIPKVREDIQRDRDEETMHRGKQFIRAIQLYYRKFHAYPPNVDALVKTNDIRFLRKKYIDPTTGKDEWKPVMFGQNKTPMAMGFFGQPLADTIGGIGPGGVGTGIGGTTPGAGTSGGTFGSSSTSGSTDSGSSAAPATGQQPTTGTDSNGNPVSNPASGADGSTGTSGSGGSGGSSSAFGGSSSNPTGSGQTFGGAGIIGFSPQSPKQSILIYKKKNHYNEWEFLYSPAIDQQQMTSGTGLNGLPASGSGLNNNNSTQQQQQQQQNSNQQNTTPQQQQQ